MKRNILYILITILFAFILSACGESEKRDFSLEGEWTIYGRTVQCSADGSPELEAEAKRLEDDLKKKFSTGPAGLHFRDYIYTFGDVIDTQLGLFAYSEDIYDKELGLGIPSYSLSGTYKRTSSILTTQALNLAVFDNWESDIDIVDLNHEHLMFSQNLTNRDLEIILYVYFGMQQSVNAKITGAMVTKAIKNKKVE